MPTTSYNGFDSETQLIQLSSQSPSLNSIKLAFGYDSSTTSSAAQTSAWRGFLRQLQDAVAAFAIDFFQMDLLFAGIDFGMDSPYYYSSRCNTSSVCNNFVNSMISDQDASISCNHQSWMFIDGKIIIATENNRAVKERQCSKPTGLGDFAFPVSEGCRGKPPFKFAFVLSIQQRIVPAKTVPAVNGIATLRTTPSSIFVLVNVTTHAPGWQIFCAALNPQEPLASVELIKNSGFIQRGSVSADTETAAIIQISNLVAERLYSVYCTAADLFGNMGSVDQAVAQVVSARTLCCRLVKIVTGPSYLWVNPASNPSASILFQYQLFSPPDVNITVAPALKDEYTKTIFQVSPTTFFASATISQLTSSFLLNPDGILPGYYTIQLIFSGPDKNRFQSSPYILQYLSAQQYPPPPTMIQSIFSDSGFYISITLSGPSDQGVTVLGNNAFNASWPCSLLFSFVGVNRASCAWVTSSGVQVITSGVTKGQATVTAGATDDTCDGSDDDSPLKHCALLPGDMIVLLPNVLRAACLTGGLSCSNYAYAKQQSISVSPPVKGMMPFIVWRLPSVISSCQDAIIDLTASYGKT